MSYTLGRLILTIMLVLSTNAIAEVKLYESTDNTGQNKKERIDSVEGFLIDLSKSLKVMEKTLSDNEKKIGMLEIGQAQLKEAQLQASAEKKKALGSDYGEARGKDNKLDSKLDDKLKEELVKLKADILVLKNDDIEKMKMNLQELNETVKSLQATFKNQLEAKHKSQTSK
jgi:hypothetical protein